MISLNLPVLFAKKGIRVADAERQTDIARATLYRLYNNEVTRIEFETLNKLCDLLDCEPADIFIYTKDETNAPTTDNQTKKP